MEPDAGKIVVITGRGKGKTTTALGEALISWGEGKNVLIIQFIKGARKYGELKAARVMSPGFVIKQMGIGFVRRASGEELEEHRLAVGKAIELAKNSIVSGNYDLIVLDEVLYCIKFGLLTTEALLDHMLKWKPKTLDLILTGRDAPQELMDLADIVIEAREIKHHYKQGIKAQIGIEY